MEKLSGFKFKPATKEKLRCMAEEYGVSMTQLLDTMIKQEWSKKSRIEERTGQAYKKPIQTGRK